MKLGIVALNLLLAAVNVQATKDTKSASPTDLSADATATEVSKTDCSKLNAAILNGLHKPEACAGITATCAGKFDVTNVHGKCISHVKESEWKKFKTTTLQQIVNSEPDKFDLNPAHLSIILRGLTLDKLPAGFTGFVVGRKELLEVIYDTKNKDTISHFLTASNLAVMEPKAFERFGKTLIASLKDDAFSRINGQQLNHIPAPSCAGFTVAQWTAIPPQAMTGLTREQANHIPVNCLNAITDDQRKNFGPPLTSAAKLASKKESPERTQAILDRIRFAHDHPCNSIPKRFSEMDKDQAKKLEDHCKPFRAFNVNDAIKLVSTSMTLLAAFATALFIL